MIEARREGLERFIQIVAGHPLLQVRYRLDSEAASLLIFEFDSLSDLLRLARNASALSYKIRAGTRIIIDSREGFRA